MRMNATTGLSLDELDHIRQSIKDILTTPMGSRVERRSYGSIIPELIDQPGNAANVLRLMAATVMAISRWEPRIAITDVGFTIDMQGKAVVSLEAVRRTGPRAGQAVSFSVKV